MTKRTWIRVVFTGAALLAVATIAVADGDLVGPRRGRDAGGCGSHDL